MPASEPLASLFLVIVFDRGLWSAGSFWASADHNPFRYLLWRWTSWRRTSLDSAKRMRIFCRYASASLSIGLSGGGLLACIVLLAPVLGRCFRG